jgi:hypothetical protein
VVVVVVVVVWFWQGMHRVRSVWGSNANPREQSVQATASHSESRSSAESQNTAHCSQTNFPHVEQILACRLHVGSAQQ